MRKILSAVLFILLLAISARSNCFSQENFSRYQRSTNVENYLLERKVDAQKSLIVPKYLGTFPFNITVDIPAQEKQEVQTDEENIDQVIFAFTQDFFLKDPEFIISFIENTKQNKLPYNCTILLSADDEKIILDTSEEIPCASDYYAERLYETSTTCCFVITDEDYFPLQIKTTASGTISPMWIVRSVQKAFHANQKDIDVQQSVLYNTESTLFKSANRFSAFTKNEITSTSFPLGHGSRDLEILDVLEKEIITSRKIGGNTLYNVFSAKTFSVWINESLLTLIYLAFAGIALFTVCFSSFAYNAKNEAVFKDLSRTWFLTPAYLLLSIIFLFLYQFVFSAAMKSPTMFFSLKTGFALCTLFAVSYVQNFYRFRISHASISFQILILCALNIFIFAFIDLSLMFVFMVEYIFILFAGKSNRRIVVLLVLILMIAPFIQPATSLYLNIRHDKLEELLKADFKRNIIFSLILVPIAFQWIKCILIFNFKDRLSSGIKKTSILSGIIISALFSTILFSLFLTGTLLITKKLTSDDTQRVISIKEKTHEQVIFNYTTSDNFDLISHKIDISTGNDKRILRCLVTLSADSNPLYECNFNYNMLSPTSASIEIPDGTEDLISLNFSSDYGVPIQIKMEFYILTDEFNAIHETREIKLTGKMNDGQAI